MCRQLGIIQFQTDNGMQVSALTHHDRSSQVAQENQAPDPTQNTQLNPDLFTLLPEEPLHWIDEICLDNMVTGENSHDLYAFYHNDNLALNGAIETDWEALEREL
jgi:hypothetical protein